MKKRVVIAGIMASVAIGVLVGVVSAEAFTSVHCSYNAGYALDAGNTWYTGKGVYGSDSTNELRFFEGNDLINLAQGNDTIVMGYDDDAIVFSTGNDTIDFGSDGAKTITADEDLIIQSTGGDVIIDL